MNKAVVLGSNYYIGLSLIRCLGKEGIEVIAMDYNQNDAYGASSKYLKTHIIVPHYRDEEEQFIKSLIAYGAKQTEKPVLFPSADPYVKVIDKYFDQLKTYYLFPMKRKNLWTEVMDKNKLNQLALKYKVAVPETLEVDTDDFDDKLENVIGYPCLVKPTDSPKFVSIFRKKMFKCHSKNEVMEAIKMANEEDLHVIVQRIIQGHDDCMYTYDAYLTQFHEVSHYMTCQKIRQFPINYGASSYAVQKYVPELHQIGGRFLKELEYSGFAEIEFKKDVATGHYYMIEINVRTTTLNEMLYVAGINFPYVAYLEMIGKPLESFHLEESSNIAFRYHIEDLISIKNYLKFRQVTLHSVLKSLRRKKVNAIWSIHDPKPYFSYWLSKTKIKY